MEHAAFASPLSDEELKELGRLVVNCGVVEFVIGMHVSSLFRISDNKARIALIHPLATKRKIDIIKAGLDTIPAAQTRALVAEGCGLADSTLRERNILLHGIWGFDGKDARSKAVVVSPKDVTGHLRPADISKNADVLAAASRKLKNA